MRGGISLIYHLKPEKDLEQQQWENFKHEQNGAGSNATDIVFSLINYSYDEVKTSRFVLRGALQAAGSFMEICQMTVTY